MSERYRPKALKRERMITLKRNRSEMSMPTALDVAADALLERVTAKVDPPRAVYYCNHGVPWKTCTICSKPTKR